MTKHKENIILISPPFGNYIAIDGCISVLGSFTLHKRKGLIKNFLKSFRPYKGGYINKIGLRNIGIKNLSLNKCYKNKAISIAAINYTDWKDIATILNTYKNTSNFNPLFIELNLSCPNVEEYFIDENAIKLFKNFNLILKLPPTKKAFEYIEMGIKCNVKYFHMSNTLPSEKGGISGPLLKKESLKHIIKVLEKYKDIHIIAGGGIYTIQDVQDYASIGINSFSLSTGFIKNKLCFYKVIQYIKSI